MLNGILPVLWLEPALGVFGNYVLNGVGLYSLAKVYEGLFVKPPRIICCGWG